MYEEDADDEDTILDEADYDVERRVRVLMRTSKFRDDVMNKGVSMPGGGFGGGG